MNYLIPNQLKTKRWRTWPYVFVCAILGCLLPSCNDDDDVQLDIFGSWYGTHSYYNPVGGTKYQYLTVRFYDNGTGQLEYESPVSFSAGSFTYTVKGDVITCVGAYASTSGGGDLDLDFRMSLRYEGDRLIPLDKYSMFILTRDGSVETSGNGDEVVDDSEKIYGVWLHSSGEVVLVLSESHFEEYTLLSGSKKIYAKKSDGSFSYDHRRKRVLINSNPFEVTLLSDDALTLKSSENIYFNYTRGSQSDIPTDGSGSNDYKTLLTSQRYGWKDKNNGMIIFDDTNNIRYSEISSRTLGSWGHIDLWAIGTYSLSGKSINCTFTDVSWQSGNDYAKDYFPGWTCGAVNNKVFTIVSISTEKLTLKINGKTYYFEPIF